MLFRLFVLAGVAAPWAAAAQAPSPVAEMVVTASRLTNSSAKSPFSITVIPQAQLLGRQSVADALGTMADIYVQAPGGRSGPSSIFLRGADPNFSVVLLDGVPLNNSTNSRGGAVNVSEIGTASLERIEVVTGSLSGLYGSGALAGVINLVVPAGTDVHHLQATIGAGSRGSATASARWQGPIGKGFGGSLDVLTDNDGQPSPGSRFKARVLTGKIAPLGQPDAGRLIVRVSETAAGAFPDSSGGDRLAVRHLTDDRKGREQLVGLTLPAYRSDKLRLDASAALLTRRDDTVSPGVARSAIDPVGIPAATDVSRYKRAAMQSVGRLDHGDWSFAGGMEALRETGSSTGKLSFGGYLVPNSFSLDRSTVSGFAEANRAGTAWTLNSGVRLDNVQGLAPHLTARAGVRYEPPGSKVVLRGSVGSGFKAPSFYALGNPFVGNANLKPEESLGGEVGLTWAGAPGTLAALTVFQTRFKGLIDFVPGPPPRLENLNLVRSTGVSGQATHAFTSRLSVPVQGQWAKTEDGADGGQLLNRPRLRFNEMLAWQVSDGLNVTFRHSFTGARDDYATPVGVQSLDAYHSVSIETAWTILPATTARLVIDNALNDKHEDALGFSAPRSGIRFFLTQTF